MPISIKNEATEQLARKLADLTGESLTETIRESLQERYERLQNKASGRSMRDDIMEIVKRCSNRPRLTTLTDDEILGYDEFGVPTR
jgi:antitoxin VapB